MKSGAKGEELIVETNKVKLSIHILYFLVAIITCQTMQAQQRTFNVMTYNIENAFDTIHDEGKNDYEYCAGGERRWTKYKLFKKLKSVCKVIVAADERKPLDLVALCEVENDTVMEYFTRKTALTNIGYHYIMTHSDDERGIDVALLYSPFTFHPIDTQFIKPHFPDHPTRDILHVAGTLANSDTLDVYVIHLPSKNGGEKAFKRSMKVTEMLKTNIDSVLSVRIKPNVIVMGDFNAEERSAQLKLLKSGGTLYDATQKLNPGTYKYQGRWSIIDHILIHTTSLKHVSSKALTLPFLTEPDNINGGIKPHRAFLGPAYKGGVSDHLPVVGRFTY